MTQIFQNLRLIRLKENYRKVQKRISRIHIHDNLLILVITNDTFIKF